METKKKKKKSKMTCRSSPSARLGDVYLSAEHMLPDGRAAVREHPSTSGLRALTTASRPRAMTPFVTPHFLKLEFIWEGNLIASS